MSQVPKSADPTPFADLPAALVDEVLDQTSAVAGELLASFQTVRAERATLRATLVEAGLVISESSLGYPILPTTCAADGSYAIERLLTTDLAAAAAVAVEGLTPPSEKRHWTLPRHKSFVAAEPHTEDTATVLRAVMLGEELRLVTDAPHDLLMLDGTLTLPLIYFNQALNKAPDNGQLNSAREFLEKCPAYLEDYLRILRSERSDRHFVGVRLFFVDDRGAVQGFCERHGKSYLTRRRRGEEGGGGGSVTGGAIPSA